MSTQTTHTKDLFTTTLLHLFRDMPNEKKIQIVKDITEEANKQKKKVKVVYDPYTVCSYEQGLYFSIIKKLDPNYTTDLYDERRDHPYSVMIVEKIQKRLNSHGRVVITLELGLLETYEIHWDENSGNETCSWPLSTFEQPPEIELPIPLDEAEKIVDKMIDEYIIERDAKLNLSS